MKQGKHMKVVIVAFGVFAMLLECSQAYGVQGPTMPTIKISGRYNHDTGFEPDKIPANVPIRIKVLSRTEGGGYQSEDVFYGKTDITGLVSWTNPHDDSKWNRYAHETYYTLYVTLKFEGMCYYCFESIEKLRPRGGIMESEQSRLDREQNWWIYVSIQDNESKRMFGGYAGDCCYGCDCCCTVQ